MKFTIVDQDKFLKKYPEIKNSFNKIAKTICSKLKITKPYYFDVTFVDDKKMKQINKEYRGVNKPTDVISFAFLDNKQITTLLLGEIYIDYEYSLEYANENNLKIDYEFKLLFAHGLLHLLGFDHANKKDEKIMFDLQEEVIR
ncbi:MAG: rRNA maturation RNase YbeY [Mycoplasmataceae bacterium]|jgi:probable rRNA maturation factor|nr:rRNA maturation RNase YbeY [Mycoplasmataceae bacterium]